MKVLKILLSLILVVAILFSIDFLGFYPVGKKTLGLLKKTPLKGPLKTWELGAARLQEWEAEQALLLAEKEQLKKKEQKLAAKREELEAQRMRLSREAEQTANLIAQLQKQENRATEQKDQQKSIAQQATLVAKMKPKQAAEVLAQLEMGTTREVLGKMDPRTAARILEQMEPYRAAQALPQ